jgi:hypothetical protein
MAYDLEEQERLDELKGVLVHVVDLSHVCNHEVDNRASNSD